MKNILDVIKENEYVHCETVEEAEEYCKIAHNQGLTWGSDLAYENEHKWYYHKNNTVYLPHTGKYGSILRQDKNFKKVSFREFKNRLKEI